MTWLKEMYRGQTLLLIIVLIVPIAIYSIAISDTVQLWITLMADREQKEKLIEQNKQESNVNSSIADIDNTTLSSFLFTTSMQNNCVMESYIPYKSNPYKEESSITIFTAEAIIIGKFIPLVNIIYSIEEFHQKWKIISTDFKVSKPNIKTGEINIALSIIIQYTQL